MVLLYVLEHYETEDCSCFSFSDKRAAHVLMLQVEEARVLLAEYNARLAKELEERKRIARMLRDFIAAQKEALTESEQRLQVCFPHYIVEPTCANCMHGGLAYYHF